MKKENVWEDFKVYGDTSEIESIIRTPGMICLDHSDIVRVLEPEGDSCISAGTGDTFAGAVTAAFAELHRDMEKVTDIVVAIWCRNRDLKVDEMKVLSDELSKLVEDVNVKWGVFIDPARADAYKITTIATGTMR